MVDGDRSCRRSHVGTAVPNHRERGRGDEQLMHLAPVGDGDGLTTPGTPHRAEALRAPLASQETARGTLRHSRYSLSEVGPTFARLPFS